METAVRIKTEHYDLNTGNILETEIIHEEKIIKPVDMIDLGYKHLQQIEILSALQDFKIKPQADLLIDNMSCPRCGLEARKNGFRKSKLHAVFTDHVVKLQKRICSCKWTSPSTIESIYGTSIHPELLEKQAKQGAENSYRKSSKNLTAESKEKRSINNVDRVRRTVDKVASVIEAEHLKDKKEVEIKQAANNLIAVVDGGHVKSNIKDSRSFEAMIGTVYKPENRKVIDKHHNEIAQKTCVASALSDKQVTIKKLMLNACINEGMHTQVTHITCLTDGANNCWSITKALKPYCKNIEQILDWFHITKRFTVINNSIEDKFILPSEKVKWHLWHGDAEQSLTKLQVLIDEITNDKVSSLLIDLYEYIERNKVYLTHYQEKHEAGLPYTSTYAEVSVNSVINIRQKCNQKMQWGRDGSHNVLQLRTSIFSKSWKKDWENARSIIYKKAA